MPTEARFLISPYELGGRELIISAINELFFLGIIKIRTIEIDSEEYQVIELSKEHRDAFHIEYQQLLIKCIKAHYRHYPEPVDQYSVLTPDRLLRDTYGRVNFSYFRFKRSHLMNRLNRKGLTHATFPFYYFRFIKTSLGKRTTKRLKYLIKELEDYYAYYKENEPEKLKSILEELGPNIILAYNIETISKNLRIWKNQGFAFDPHWVVDPLTMESIDSIELPDVDVSNFEFPDIGFDFPFFGDN